jgi:hypothetical protein
VRLAAKITPKIKIAATMTMISPPALEQHKTTFKTFVQAFLVRES